MNIRSPHDPEIVDTVRRYVIWAIDEPGEQRYLKLLNANLLRENEPDRESFGAALAEDARQISDEELEKLLSSEWRARLTAAWLRVASPPRREARHQPRRPVPVSRRTMAPFRVRRP